MAGARGRPPRGAPIAPSFSMWWTKSLSISPLTTTKAPQKSRKFFHSGSP